MMRYGKAALQPLLGRLSRCGSAFARRIAPHKLRVSTQELQRTRRPGVALARAAVLS
jgi:hypothetical protein